MRGRGILGPWELWRKIALGGVVVVAIFLYVALMIPVGFMMLGILLGAAFVWKDLSMTDVNKGMYIMMTFPFRLATFFVSYKMNARQLLTLNTIAFGAPTDDEDHEIPAGLAPWTRLSSYWNAFGALLLGIPDIFLVAAHYPIWGTGFLIPWFISYPLSVIGWFVALQTVVATRRIQGDKETIAAVEPRPAVLINKSRAELPFMELLPKALIYGSGPAVLLLLVGLFAKLPIWLTLLIVLGAFVMGLAIAASRIMASAYVVGWQQREERRQFWSSAFEFMRDKIPGFNVEMELPTLEEHENTQLQRRLARDRIARARRSGARKNGGEIEVNSEENQDEPYDPQVKIATFGYPQGSTFDDFKEVAARISNALGVDLCAISPIGNITTSNEEVSGTVGSAGFRVWWTETDPPPLLSPEIDLWMRELLVRSKVIPALAKVKNLGYCTMLSCSMITRPESKRQIMEIKVIPPVGVSTQTFFASLETIKAALDVEWVRIKGSDDKSASAGGQAPISVFIGDEPTFNDRTETSFVRPPAVVRKMIDEMDWQYYWSVLKLQGSNGFPKLIRREATTQIVDKLIFNIPSGMAYEEFPTKMSAIKTTSGYSFMEMQQGDEVETSNMSEEERIRAEREQQSMFTVIASREDPLKRTFKFMDFEDQILPGRISGQEKISWSPGVMADDNLAVYDWDAEEPHLLIAGASGSGKSVVASAFILQVMQNNGPGEARFWMIEPKNEMQVYRDVDVVERFVDSWTPDEDFIKNAADLMWDARVEMDNRNKIFSSHPKAPKKLSKARDIAKLESERNGTPLEDHPLYLPYLFIIMEECATLFAESSNAEEKNEQKRLLTNTAEIARKARSAGIYLVALTQYPTNASIPSVIRQQMRRIGLKCQNDMASRVVIEENGLEKIKTKGVGMISQGGNYRSFRGFWVMDGDPDEGKPNDILDILAKLPKNRGAGFGGGSGGSAGTKSRIVLPKPDQTIYNIWDSTYAGTISNLVDEKKKTRDVTFADLGYQSSKDPVSTDAALEEDDVTV
jgi:ABC-type dipeptide/oligopeptide/nickel transport system ATPase component